MTYTIMVPADNRIKLIKMVDESGEERTLASYIYDDMVDAGMSEDEIWGQAFTDEQMKEITASVVSVEKTPFGKVRVTMSDGTYFYRDIPNGTRMRLNNKALFWDGR